MVSYLGHEEYECTHTSNAQPFSPWQVWPPLTAPPVPPVQLAAASSYATAVAVGQGVEAATAAAEATAKAAEEAGLGEPLVMMVLTVMPGVGPCFIGVGNLGDFSGSLICT